MPKRAEHDPAPDELGAESTKTETTRPVTFVRFWSSDRGAFVPGSTAELPATIAKSLKREGVIE